VPSAFFAHFGENTGRSPAISGAERSGRLKSKRTVRRSSTVARRITSNCALNSGEACGLVSVSNEYLTSAAVIGSPFEKRARGSIWKVADVRSGATSTLCAISGYSEASSSQLRCISVSNIRFLMSGAGEPRTRKGLSES
jgi:hypothetical protein